MCRFVNCIYPYCSNSEKMNRMLIMLLGGIVFVSCHNKSLDNKYCSKKFSFPDSLVEISLDYDNDYYGLTADYKIVVYYDSMCCTPCVMNTITTWNDIVKYSENTPDIVSLVVAFSPKSDLKPIIKEMMLSNNPLCYPLYLDMENEIHQMNDWLPTGMFVGLLNKDNMVVATGSPINPTIWKKYLSIINN